MRVRLYLRLLSPDGQYIATGGDDGTVSVWDAKSGGEITHVTHDGLSSVAFSPDSQFVLSIGSDARIWNVETGLEIARISHEGRINLLFSVRMAVMFCQADVIITLAAKVLFEYRDITTLQGYEINRIASNGGVRDLSLSPDGNYFVLGYQNGFVDVVEAETGIEIAHMYHGGEVYSVAFSSDGKYVAYWG